MQYHELYIKLHLKTHVHFQKSLEPLSKLVATALHHADMDMLHSTHNFKHRAFCSPHILLALQPEATMTAQECTIGFFINRTSAGKKYTKADKSEAMTMEKVHQQTESKIYQIAPKTKYLASCHNIQSTMT